MKKDIKVFDTHCDTAFACLMEGQELFENRLHIDLKRLSEYGHYTQIFAIFAMDNFEASFEKTFRFINSEIKKHGDIMALCKTTGDIEKCRAENKIAALISVEGAELLACSEEKLLRAKENGVSSVNITWNYANALSGSIAEREDEGLSPAGRSFVKKCFDLGVAVDVSHISEPAFWDVYEIAAGRPFIASHSNAKALCTHKRNLTDDQISALAEFGGVAGINLYADFLGEKPTVGTVIDHIDRFLKIGGENCVGIGGDLDGCDSLPEGIAGVQDVYKIYDELIRLGYGRELADKIFGGNMLRVFKKIIG